MAARIDLTGKVFTKLTAIERVEGPWWDCLCSCGNPDRKRVKTELLTSGRVRSCGCLQKIARSLNLSKGRRPRFKYPETPKPYPEAAAKVFAEHKYLIDRLLRIHGHREGLEDVAVDLLLRACWIVDFLSSSDSPIVKVEGYLWSWLCSDRAMITCLRIHGKVGQFKRIGDTVTDTTLPISATDSAEFSRVKKRRLKFKRR